MRLTPITLSLAFAKDKAVEGFGAIVSDDPKVLPRDKAEKGDEVGVNVGRRNRIIARHGNREIHRANDSTTGGRILFRSRDLNQMSISGSWAITLNLMLNSHLDRGSGRPCNVDTFRTCTVLTDKSERSSRVSETDECECISEQSWCLHEIMPYYV
jgi:hypothetical protein